MACEPLVIDADLPDHSQRLVVNCVFEAGAPWKVGVTKAMNLSAQGNGEFIDFPAAVEILENGVPVTTMTWLPPNPNRGEKNGYYLSNSAALAGRTYEIRVTAPGYPDVSAICAVPMPVELGNAEVLSWEPNGNSEIPIILEFDDPAGIANYYEAWISTETRWYDPYTGELMNTSVTTTPLKTHDLIYSKRAEPFVFSDPVPPPAPVFFSDQGMDGEHLVIQALAYIGPNNSEHFEVSHRIILRSVSLEYFDNMHTKALLLNTVNDPFAQPVQVYSNVIGGYGIFAAYSETAVVLD